MKDITSASGRTTTPSTDAYEAETGSSVGREALDRIFQSISETRVDQVIIFVVGEKTDYRVYRTKFQQRTRDQICQAEK
jgi:hypothetical protein